MYALDLEVRWIPMKAACQFAFIVPFLHCEYCMLVLTARWTLLVGAAHSRGTVRTASKSVDHRDKWISCSGIDDLPDVSIPEPC